MANPAPTINQINAFNATQGTVIDFNIIGGTELVRSNKIYIYDLSDNSLICTHLYPSTESIHELPPNNDADIVYADGKSSADFVNNKQYYAQIQTFTNVAGTQGESGLSVAKLFWCLPTPTLEFDTIPASISITSYNATATYDTNITSQSVTVPNIVQQYQFDLYTVTGTLVQSSGVIVGNGEQEGATTVWDLSYNFSGMTPNTSYYFTLSVTTTEGMTLTTQSSTFMVSIDTPTFGKATVVNDACNGYISVTSNLSSEYGGSASGSIASFTVDSVNHISKCEVTLEPIQDLHGYDSPWVGGAGKNLFNKDTITDNAWINDQGVEQPVTGFWLSDYIPISENTTYFRPDTGSGRNAYYASDKSFVSYVLAANQAIASPQGAAYIRIVGTGTTYTSAQFEKGSVATTYTPYANICPISGRDSVGVVGCGKNLATIIEDGYVPSINNGQLVPASGCRTDYIKCFSSQPYTLWCHNSAYTLYMFFYDADKNFITYTNGAGTLTATTPATAKYIMLRISGGFVIAAGKAQLELGSTATTYEPYNGTAHTIPLGQTVYGGMLDVVSGVLTVTHAIEDLSNMSWSVGGLPSVDSGVRKRMRSASLENVVKHVATIQVVANAKCSAFGITSYLTGYNTPSVTGMLAIDNDGIVSVFVPYNDYADGTAFKNAMNGVYLAYELATPTTIQLTPTQVHALLGQNNIFSDSGDVAVEYNILITNLLVKRKDLSDVSGKWLTLYEKPILQASDMDFTYIDFLNQYGKTYQYALVPLLIQSQSGVVVEVEGGYTVSDNVTSQFDYVFITDVTGSEKLKANVGYGNVNMSQNVGSILPIGAKYPVVVTNSHNAYHSGSISGYIVPDDFYTNGNLSRVAMVAKRDELEQFLVNKKPKIIKDWNGKIWLVMITGDVDCSFDSNYGMGMVTFTASWVEVGDATSQGDLQNTGLINVGGV